MPPSLGEKSGRRDGEAPREGTVAEAQRRQVELDVAEELEAAGRGSLEAVKTSSKSRSMTSPPFIR